jgi:hypothetical protein
MARGQQNYATYRSEFGATEPPHLPYIGVHLSDLVALDQLPTWIDPSGSADLKRQHVNFKKMRKLEQVHLLSQRQCTWPGVFLHVH